MAGPDGALPDPLDSAADAVADGRRLTAEDPALTFAGSDVPPWLAENLRVLSEIAAFGEAPDDVPSREPPFAVGPYEAVEPIGRGGMGEVYRAVQMAPLRREVALKIVRAGRDSARVLDRFEAERQTLASLDHDGIARVFDAGIADDGRPYFVMELVRGMALTAYCDLHRVDLRERLGLFRDVCAAVQHAHQRGVIHRDLKPSNVLVTEEGGRAVAKVIDFGVAKATGELAGGIRRTEEGQILGTPEYMSPEQLDAPAAVDTRADVYSLGVLLYELLTGSLPFDPARLRAGGLGGLARTLRDTHPDAPSTRVRGAGAPDEAAERAARRRTTPASLARHLRGDLDWITMRAMAKEPERRYASASELAADVERHLRDEPVLAGPPGLAYHASKLARRHRTAVGAGAVVLAALLAGLATTRLQAARALRAEAAARESAAVAADVNRFLAGILSEANPEVNPRSGGMTVAEALDESAARIDGAFAGHPETEAGIRRTLGSAYDALGRNEAAREQLDRAAELARGAGDATLRIETLEALAQARIHAGDADGALAAAREEVRVATDSLPASDPRRRTAQLHLARTTLRSGNPDEADSLFRAALTPDERAGAPADAAFARGLHEYASLLGDQGRFDDAESALRRSVDLLGEALGADHPDVLRASNNLADFLRRAGKPAEAESLFAADLQRARRVLPADHRDVANTLLGLGGARLAAGDLEGAAAPLEEAVEMFRRGAGARHPSLALALGQLGELRQTAGNADGAITAFEEAYSIDRERLGDDHPETIQAENNLASALRLRGELAAAEAHFRHARGGMIRRFGRDNYQVAVVSQNLAKTLADEGRTEDAESEYRAAIDLAIRTFPPGHVNVDIMRANYGELLLRQRRFAAAESLLVPAADAIAAALGADHPRARQVASWRDDARRAGR